MAFQWTLVADAARSCRSTTSSYFTIQSNTIAAVVFLVGAARAAPATPGWDLVRGASALNMTVTYVVFALLLAAYGRRRHPRVGQHGRARPVPAGGDGRLGRGPAGARGLVPWQPDLARLPDRVARVHDGPRPDRRLVPVPVPRPGERRLRDGRAVRRSGSSCSGSSVRRSCGSSATRCARGGWCRSLPPLRVCRPAEDPERRRGPVAQERPADDRMPLTGPNERESADASRWSPITNSSSGPSVHVAWSVCGTVARSRRRRPCTCTRPRSAPCR